MDIWLWNARSVDLVFSLEDHEFTELFSILHVPVMFWYSDGPVFSQGASSTRLPVPSASSQMVNFRSCQQEMRTFQAPRWPLNPPPPQLDCFRLQHAGLSRREGSITLLCPQWRRSHIVSVGSFQPGFSAHRAHDCAGEVETRPRALPVLKDSRCTDTSSSWRLQSMSRSTTYDQHLTTTSLHRVVLLERRETRIKGESMYNLLLKRKTK